MSSAHAIGTTNHLAGESSPYLLLHQHNPVDWYPWGEEALEKARREDKPIFLSVGYSTCYWCHVMERESFSNPEVAERMNRDFVNIKLDREERPDLDEIYMAATQILTQQGGWPNSVFLNTELKPFFAGTYFPPEDRWGRPGFASVLSGLAEAWKTRRSDVDAQGEELAGAMRRFLEERARPADAPPGPEVAVRGLETLGRRFDRQWGGFGGAPKFPTPSNLYLCLEVAERPEAMEMLTKTLDEMARGGIYDQLGGGFHRYATDHEWKIPHFEKMLYDNGFLLEIYARHHALTGDPQSARIVRETAAWIAREMTSPEGAFYSAIDAETHGHEGAFYVWTREDIYELLGREDFAFLAPILGFDGPAFFEQSHYVLHLPDRLEEAAKKRRMSEDELFHEVKALEVKLFEARARRERPLTDDKILTDWNGMTITGLAVAGALLGERDYVARAARAATFVLETLRPAGGPLLHTWRQGKGKIAAYLGDYAFFVRGLLALHRATGDERWLHAAAELTEEQIRRLRDPHGGFYVAGESPDVLFRSKDVFDGATPSGNAVAILNLLDLAERTGDSMWRNEARFALQAFGSVIQTHTEAMRMMAIAVRRYHALAEGVEGVVGRSESPEEQAAIERSADAPATHKMEDLAASLVTLHLHLDPERDGWRPFRLSLSIEPGWHLQANPASEEFLIPTALRAEGAELREVRYPEGSQVESQISDRPLAVYEGTVEITGEVGEVTLGGRLVLTFQVCDDSKCLPEAVREVALLPM
jgi:uncharacterized protein